MRPIRHALMGACGFKMLLPEVLQLPPVHVAMSEQALLAALVMVIAIELRVAVID